MIVPSIGRVVWYHPVRSAMEILGEQPFAALVAFVHNDRLVNLTVFDHGGMPSPKRNVPLWQEGDATPSEGAPWCTWMPYQLGQAARTEAAEGKLAT